MDRRNFIRKTVVGAAGAIAVPALISSCSGSGRLKDVEVPDILGRAPEGKPLRAGLIGCGGRGTGAAGNFVDAGDGLSIVALADVFQDKLDECKANLAKRGIIVPEENCFTGFDAYKKVIDSDVDVVLLCTPPVFRPEHFAYAVEKGKHVFCEKPCAVDPVGARRMLALSEQAKAKGLCVISGTIRRSEKDCIETYRRVAGGMIGEIVSAHITRFGGSLWYKERRSEWTDMEYMLRNWPNFCWTSGDFIVEQFIHEIDQMSWFTGDRHPVQAEAVGGRARRVTGDMYDMMSVEYVYENQRRAHCVSRQISGCDSGKAVLVYGTKGYTNCFDTVWDLDGNILWKFPAEGSEGQYSTDDVPNPYIEEHVRLVTAIRTGVPVNDMEKHVQSVLMCIMARMSAYTGRFITWDEILASNEKLGPDTYEFGPVPGIKEEIPLPGKEMVL